MFFFFFRALVFFSFFFNEPIEKKKKNITLKSSDFKAALFAFETCIALIP